MHHIFDSDDGGKKEKVFFYASFYPHTSLRRSVVWLADERNRKRVSVDVDVVGAVRMKFIYKFEDSFW